MSNSTTYAVNGRYGRLQFFGTQDLRLTKWGLHLKGDAIKVTNTRSPAVVLGLTNFTTQLLAEFLPGNLEADLMFEGVYTIYDDSVPTYNRLLSMSSGTPGLIPGTSNVAGPVATTAYGLAGFVLTPDNVRVPGDTIAGSCVITSFEVDGEVEGEVTFKGTAKISGSITPSSHL